MKFLYLLNLLLLTAGAALGDKPSQEVPQTVVTGTVEKVPAISASSKQVNHKSGSFAAPQASAPYSPAAASSNPYAGASSAAQPDVGSQGYYYYYYPVVNQKDSSEGHFADEVVEPSGGGGLGGLIAGKGLLIALAIGAIIILAVAGTTINLNNGRSLQDITEAAGEKLDVLTGLVVDAIDLYDSVN